RRIQRATYLLSIEDGVTKRNKNGKVLGCGTHPNMESFHHPTFRVPRRAARHPRICAFSAIVHPLLSPTSYFRTYVVPRSFGNETQLKSRTASPISTSPTPLTFALPSSASAYVVFRSPSNETQLNSKTASPS
ncbi:MAG: hypothetical protein U9N46_13025, partial [Euryarchaeota archaeon]|nr:hypothetical protein [Euryarchaeota archaeon]